jgi:tetratricopeptide (TPR) repeat protein
MEILRMSAENEVMLLAEGIEAAKTGDRFRARELLRKVLGHNPRNELAWLWLSSVVENEGQRRECLIRVLHINPLNEAARQGMIEIESGVQPAAHRPGTGPLSQKEAQSGKPVPCPFCNKQTASTLPSCEHCGQDIILPCPNCMEPIHLWETTRCACGEGLRHYIFFPDGIDHEGLGQRYSLKERWEAAAHQWSRALKEGSHVVMLHRKLAQVYERLGNSEEAALHRQIASAQS